MKRFALIGAAGYIAPRHLKAIKETGNELVAALDRFDSVGIMDSYFPQVAFFVEFERFDRHLEKLRRAGTPVDYISICTPNYLHDAHIRFALRHGAHAICEKPLVLNPWNVDALAESEAEALGRIHTILQLRLHPSLQALKERLEKEWIAAAGEKSTPSARPLHEVELTYITARGGWYDVSWKGEEQRSGGVATNIGIHFYDMLHWLFGEVRESVVHVRDRRTASGLLTLERAKVRWFLSIDTHTLPLSAREAGKTTYRSITIDGDEIEFSDGFTDLHTKSYEDILAGRGFGLADARTSIQTVHDIRNATPMPPADGICHPLVSGPALAHV